MKELILLETKRKFFSNRVGSHRSIFAGSGLEFKDIIRYDSSQSVRHINWKKSTKEAIVANSYYDDRELNIAIVYLNSGSMRFANKEQKAIEALTALSSVTIESKESLSTLFFNSKQSHFFAPTKRAIAIDLNYNYASSTKPQGKIETSKLTKEIRYRVKRRSILFVIGDFLELIDFSQLTPLYEIYAIVIRDRAEEELALSGECNVVDLNSQKQQLLTINKRSQKVYNKLFKEYDKELEISFLKSQVKFTKIYTNENTVDKLVELLRWR